MTTTSDATPTKMLVRTPTPGWDAEVFAAAGAGRPTELSGWGEPVGEVGDAATAQEIDLNVGSPLSYFLLWFTKARPRATRKAATRSRSATSSCSN